MSADLILDLARAGHMSGLAFGLGLALCADLIAFSTIFRSIHDRDVWLMTLLHRLILCGLVLLWVSGLALLYIRTGFDPARFSPKLWLKLAVVVTLSANAALIGRVALPVFAAHVGHSFGMLPLRLRLRLSALAGLSATCWLSALALGVFRHLKVMDFTHLAFVFVPIFFVGFIVALLCAKLAQAVNGMPGRRDWPAEWREETPVSTPS